MTFPFAEFSHNKIHPPQQSCFVKESTASTTFFNMADMAHRRSYHVSARPRHRSPFSEQRAVRRKVTCRDSPDLPRRQVMTAASRPRRGCKKYVSNTYKKTVVLFRLKKRSLIKKLFKSNSKSPQPRLTRSAPNIPQPHLTPSAPCLSQQDIPRLSRSAIGLTHPICKQPSHPIKTPI